jgi:hypothetical protein
LPLLPASYILGEMRRFCIGLLLAGSLPAQWLHLPTRGVPRKADGSPNLEAPAPKTADGKSDFSGMWIAREVLPCDSKERGVQCVELPLTPQVVDIALGLKEGLPYQPWAAELVKRRAKELGVNDPHTHCLPPNFPRAWSFPESQKILQMPGLLVVLHEFNASYRQIFFDGRTFPEDMTPAWSGYSVGHWEGDRLVVESRGFRDDGWLDIKGNPLTDAATVTERIRRPNYGNLEIQVTVNDPKAYTQPWTITLHEKIVLDTEMMDFMCLENEKDVAHMVR